MLLFYSFFLSIFVLNLVEGIKPQYDSEEELPLPSKRPQFDPEEELVRRPKRPRFDPDEELPLSIGIRPKPIPIDPEEELPLPLDVLEDDSLFFSNIYPQPIFYQPRPFCRCSPLYSQIFQLMRNLQHKPTNALNFSRQIPKWLKEQSRARRAYQTQKKKLTIGELLMREGIIKPPAEKLTSKITNKVEEIKGNKIHIIKDKRNKKKKKPKVEESIEMESEEEEYDEEDLDDSFWDSDEDDNSDEDSSDTNTNYNYNVNTLLARRKLPSKPKEKKRINLYKKKKVG